MARFYSALATDGTEPTPMIKRGHAKAARKRIRLDAGADRAAAKGDDGRRLARAERRPRAAIKGVNVAGKTGTAQTMRYDANGKPLYYAWFAGMAPAEAIRRSSSWSWCRT